MDKKLQNILTDPTKRNLKESTLRSYKSTFNSLAKAYDRKYLNAKWVHEHCDEILGNLEGESHSKQVSRGSALLILLSPKGKKCPPKKYQKTYDRINKYVTNLNAKYFESKQSQVKTEKESKNWVEWDKIELFLRKREVAVFADVKSKDGYYNYNDLNNIQQLLILALYVYLPPRRLDYSGMEVVTEKLYKKMQVLDNNIKKKNLLVVKSSKSKYFSFGTDACKSKLKDGQSCLVVTVPPKLNKIINLWLQYNESEILLLNKNGSALNKLSLGKQVISIFERKFDKRIGVSLLRKIYLSHVFKNDTSYKLKSDLSVLMNHAVNVAESIYVKKHDYESN